MSTTLTVRERLTLCKWADSLPGDITPTLARGVKWVKSEFGKDVPESALAELREKAKLFEAAGLIPIFDASGPQQGVAALEGIPENEKDWHPGGDGKVLDRVHPSLWPLVFGKSRIVALGACGIGDVIPVPKKRYPNNQSSDDLWSVKYQWLPCDIDIEEGKPKIMSYINDLHPKHHAGLYTAIEKVLEKALPMWDIIYR
ncbi:hypothetical protein Brms1b_013474 [Colletotrichum noveboracense]|nr:hypothetical protein CBS470a_012717 [Colletotrichum nupharicola]KAJ0298015.1 hypothetical protein Brms1b_013474 [Colletotrichum noveboracense]